MSTLTDEETQVILAPLDDYFAATPTEFSIGLQNFQSIRQYTKIPLAPVTLIYGQNSAGKSAIHDALIFLHDFFSKKTIPRDYLDRWASRQRINRPLMKDYIGQPEDVVFSIDAWAWGGDRGWDGNSVLDVLWDRKKAKEPFKFQLRFHFSYFAENPFKKWELQETHLFLGKDEFLSYKQRRRSCLLVHGCLSINTKHLLFDILGQLYGQPIDQMAKEIEFLNGETEIVDQWLQLKDVSLTNYKFAWLDPLDDDDQDLNDYYHLANAFRDLLDGMIGIPSMLAARILNSMAFVPPLRPVPTKNEACFRISSSDSFIFYDVQPWKALAKEIRDKQLGPLDDALRPHMARGYDYSEKGAIDYVNHVLQHPLFLNTGYEVVGECCFLLSTQQIKEIMNDKNDNMGYLDAEVNLRLRYVPDDFMVEIEDVGVGISQIIPVLCAISNGRRIYIHQPELHLHPKQQSHLGDIFIERINDDLYKDSIFKAKPYRYFFIETHSEHILLRILRRIRETNRGDIRHKLFGFTAEQLCVLYVDKDENGDSKVMRLRVAENGEFIDRWPHGFFTERDEDLFDE